jgi:hypothetical protein
MTFVDLTGHRLVRVTNLERRALGSRPRLLSQMALSGTGGEDERSIAN